MRSELCTEQVNERSVVNFVVPLSRFIGQLGVCRMITAQDSDDKLYMTLEIHTRPKIGD